MTAATAPGAPAELWRDQLTPRRAQVLELAAEGLSEKEIAEELGITRNTVKKHVTDIHAGLRVTNRVAAARWWWEHVELAELRSRWGT